MLAAGGGRRLGAPKALLPCDGMLLVERALGVMRAAGCDPVVVVLGAEADEVAEQADLSEAVVVVNKAWGTGVGSSLRAGLRSVGETQAEAAVLMPVDMPGLTADAVRRVAQLPYPDALACGTFEGRRSHPVLLGRAHWSGAATLANADVGLRPYLLAHSSEVTEIACDGVAAGDDVDTPEEAARVGISVQIPRPRAEQ